MTFMLMTCKMHVTNEKEDGNVPQGQKLKSLLGTNFYIIIPVPIVTFTFHLVDFVGFLHLHIKLHSWYNYIDSVIYYVPLEEEPKETF